ncbi:hypothetical protein GCM10025886_16600 [Tetragenococcus halophilus subsp. flandriensis]|nr:ABC transporter permease [Tetragenococcus halophilus]GMA08509.1 hypothetical protein GCM10025886_16600 [Tetragenococcus halophilus subsp. flandriensis]
MLNLIKKDFLTLSKNKSELIELLFMPILLIAILGFTLGDLLMGDFNISTFDVGIVNKQNFEADLDRLEQDLLAEEMPEEAVDELVADAEDIEPVHMLVDLLEGEDFEDLMRIHTFDSTQSAQERMEEDELTGYITIPEEFSYDIWQ